MISYTHIEQCEYLSLDRPGRPGGLPLVAIRLGRHEGRWANAIEFNQEGGDFWGMGEPLGFHLKAPRTFETRDEAIADAVTRFLAKVGDRPLMAAQIAWAKAQMPQAGDQLDMFGEVA